MRGGEPQILAVHLCERQVLAKIHIASQTIPNRDREGAGSAHTNSSEPKKAAFITLPPTPPHAPSTHTHQELAPERWAAIKLLALDVDGVLTDGGLTFDSEGYLSQTFHVRDGFAIVAARRAGLTIAWISGRPSAVAQHRSNELGVHHCILACDDKAKAMRQLQTLHNLTPEQCCFVADDFPDLPAFGMTGVKVAVADAVPEIIQHADYVTRVRGGRGAVREVIEHILKAQGHWDVLISRFTRTDWTESETENLQR